MGLDRIAMLKYGIPDLRDMFSADLRWLRHYGFAALDVPTLAGGCRAEVRHEIHALLAQGSSRDLGVGRGARRASCRRSGSRSKASTIRPRSSAPSPSRACSRPSSIPTPTGCRCARSTPARGVVEVVCGAPNAKTGMIGVFAPIGSYIPGTGSRSRRSPCAASSRTACWCRSASWSCPTTTRASSSCRPSSASKLGKRYADVLGLADPGHRGEAHAQPARLHGRARHRPRSRRRRPRQAEAREEDRRRRGRLRLPRRHQARFPEGGARRLPVLRRPLHQGRQERRRRRPGCSSASRPSACGRSTRWSTSPTTSAIDRGRPLHVYDADKLEGRHPRAPRQARARSSSGLDGKTHEVDETMCVIADDRAVLGFGGILGGEDTGCTRRRPRTS